MSESILYQGRSKGGAWGGLSPPKILVQHIIYKRIHVDVIVCAVPQIEHFPVLQAVPMSLEQESVVNRRSIRDASFYQDHEY